MVLLHLVLPEEAGWMMNGNFVNIVTKVKFCERTKLVCTSVATFSLSHVTPGGENNTKRS